ncbi:SGNH/GDSL hydrolase family protein [Proteiniphilum sp.]|uniref:SGNH/GDSL hydrolase family protein n=1 Tax=Proteiniphilum sp. TaxID=1926877 RepID=UPI003333B94E
MVHRLLVIATVFLGFSFWSKPLPRVFLIGDSISMHYTPYLKQYLSETVQLDRKGDDGEAGKNLDIPVGANGGDSQRVLEYLQDRFKDKDFKLDYLLLNCGLHDIKRDPATGTIQIGENDYRRNLSEIFHISKKKGVKPIWIRTTWVVDSIHNAKSTGFQRFDADVRRYNAIADSICNKNDIPVIDLYHFSKQIGANQFIDHVHFKEPARVLQAAYIAGHIECIIQSKQK